MTDERARRYVVRGPCHTQERRAWRYNTHITLGVVSLLCGTLADGGAVPGSGDLEKETFGRKRSSAKANSLLSLLTEVAPQLCGISSPLPATALTVTIAAKQFQIHFWKGHKMTTPMIVVVSDELEIQQGFASTLGFCGLSPVLASTTQEAITILNGHSVSLIFCSDEMPRNEFEDLIRQPLSQPDKVPVVVFSSRDEWRRYLNFLHLGAYDYILLPLRQGEIERVLRNILRLRVSEIVGRVADPLPSAECEGVMPSIR